MRVLSKINKYRITKFYAQYQISVLIIHPCFGENRKSWFEYLRNSPKNFLHTRYINFFTRLFRLHQEFVTKKLTKTQIWLSNLDFQNFSLSKVRFSSNATKKSPFLCLFMCNSRLLEKNCWQSKFGRPMLGFGSDFLNKKRFWQFSSNCVCKFLFRCLFELH